jgi:hypothetical protein
LGGQYHHAKQQLWTKRCCNRLALCATATDFVVVVIIVAHMFKDAAVRKRRVHRNMHSSLNLPSFIDKRMCFWGVYQN